MRIYKKKYKKSLFDITCDICKSSCKTSLEDYEFANLKAQWGYSSRKDGEECDLHICENCFDKTINFLNELRLKSGIE